MAVETTESADAVAPTTVLEITDAALERVLEVRNAEDDPSSLALRIEVTGTRGSEYTYDLAFEPLDAGEPTDVREGHGDLTVVLPAGSVDPLRGATLDLPSAAGQGGLVIRNPNRADPLAGAELELTGDVAEQVQQLLAEAINPSLAGHGGYASLVGVDGDRVFLTMGGGCQGCAMSQATMVQGISRTITEAIPEVREVIDATDHTAGDNPFYR